MQRAGKIRKNVRDMKNFIDGGENGVNEKCIIEILLLDVGLLR